MATVLKVKPWQNPTSGKQQFYVEIGDGDEVFTAVCFSPQADSLVEGDGLPDGWLVEAPKQEGWKPMLKAPAAQGGGGKGFAPRPVGAPVFQGSPRQAAWGNTEAGEKYVQERMDRRTALMTAKDCSLKPDNDEYVVDLADDLYSWLRKNLDVSVPRRTDEGGNEAVAVPQKERSGEAVKTARVGADTPLDGGGESAQAGDASSTSPSTPPSSSHAAKWTPKTEGWK